MVRIEKIEASKFKLNSWAGGKTAEIAIFPRTASYKDREFLWRISSATCEKEESRFTQLEGFNRILSVIKGDISLLVGKEEKEIRLSPYELFSFDGGERIVSYGQCTDFNVMTAKGKCKAAVRPLTLSNEEYKLPLTDALQAFVLFCTEGKMEISLDSEVFSLDEGDAAVISKINGETAEIALKALTKGFAVFIGEETKLI